MSKRLAALIAAAMLPALAFAVPAQADAQYPYTLTDVGTLGGPQSFINLPGFPITGQGAVLGTLGQHERGIHALRRGAADGAAEAEGYGDQGEADQESDAVRDDEPHVPGGYPVGDPEQEAGQQDREVAE